MVEINIADMLKHIISKWLIIVISALLCALLGYGASRIIPKQYSAQSKVYIKGNSSISATLADLQIGSYLSNDYEIIFKSRPVLEKTIKQLKLDYTTSQLSKMVTANTITDTRILSITCKSTSAELSRDIVNAVVKHGIAKVNEIDAKQPYVIEEAIASKEPISLSMTKMIIAGGAGGLFLSIAILALLYIFNDRIETTEDLEKLDFVVLGQIYEDESFNPLSKDPKPVQEKEEKPEDNEEKKEAK